MVSLSVSSLNSGSNGNCYYISNGQEAILVDVGLSCKETERRMKQVGLSMQSVKAILITHEHSDHIKGLELLSRKYQLPVYITAATLANCRFTIDPSRVRDFAPFETFRIGAFEVLPFPKQHDAADPYSFTVSCEGVSIGVFTDIGIPCENLIDQFRQCHAAFLETNYDTDMLENGRYPIHLKRRIRSGKGHLSNAQALEVFLNYRPSFMTHLFLSHLSQDNNNPALVQELFTRHSAGTDIIVASRHEPTAVYTISLPVNKTGTAHPPVRKRTFVYQASLF